MIVKMCHMKIIFSISLLEYNLMFSPNEAVQYGFDNSSSIQSLI